MRSTWPSRPGIAVLCVASLSVGFFLSRTPTSDVVSSAVEAGRDPYLGQADRSWEDGLRHLIVRSAPDAASFRQPARTLGGGGAARHLPAVTDDQRAHDPAHPARPMVTDGDLALAERLRDVPSVVDVTVVAPGVIAVAMSGDPFSLSAVSGVATVGPDLLLAPASTSPAWPLDDPSDIDVDAADAWRVTDGSGIVVAVIDGGFDVAHPDLAGAVWSNPDEQCGDGVDDDGNGLVDDCTGWDFVDGDGDVSPAPDATPTMRDHGTQMAGIIAARHDGVGADGIAPGARLMLLKAGTRSALPSSAVAGAIRYATDQGADVIDLSISTEPGIPLGDVAPLQAAVAHAQAAGVVIVAAAGNEGADVSSAPPWPAGMSSLHDGVIAVGATDRSDRVAPFSNRGAVDLWAPGTAIVSSTPGGNALISGSSAAAALVAGTAALALASGVAPAAVRATLEATADQTVAGPRLNAARAVGALPADRSVDVTFAGLGAVRAGQESAIDVTVRVDGTALAAPSIRMWLAAAAPDTMNGALSVWAVDGAVVRINDAAGPIGTTVSSAGGELEAIVPGDPAQLSTGYRLRAALQLPAGEYSIVVEVLEGGRPVGSPVVGAFTVGTTPDGLDLSAPPTVPTAPVAPAPTAPLDPTLDAPTPATPPIIQSGASAPPSTSPTIPPPTTKTPATPDTDGPYRLDDLRTGDAGLGGGTAVLLTGAFPTDVPLFVWFGTIVVETKSADGTTAVVLAPTATETRTVDVSVRFTANGTYSLTLPQAFTFRPTKASGLRSTTWNAGPPEVGLGVTLVTPRSGSVLERLTPERFTPCRAVVCPGVSLSAT